MAFRLQAKHLSLTYPQCDGTKQDLVLHLQAKLGRWTILYYVVAQETHADGGLHFHAAIGLNKKCDIRNADLLDFNGSHGNYQGTRDPAAWVQYCTKDDQSPLTYGDLPTADANNKKRAVAAMHEAETETSFFEAAKEACGIQYFTMHDQLTSYANKKFKRELPAYAPTYTNFNTPISLNDWVSGSLAKPQVGIYDYALVICI